MPTTATQRPNILLVLTDQQRYDSLGINGNRICQTPNIDALACEGMNFTQAFTVSALCSPARASLLTGLYPHRHGLSDNVNARQVGRRDLSAAMESYAAVLQEAGYITGYVGKWHVGQETTPLDWGFDDFWPGPGWHEWRPEGIDFGHESAIRLAYAPEKPLGAHIPLPLEDYPEVQRADQAIRLLDHYAEQQSPFCLRLDFFGPHYPNYLPEPYASMYRGASIPAWDNFQARQLNAHQGEKWLRQRWAAPLDTWSPYAEWLAYYYGHISCLDNQIGRVLRHLDALGLAENTLVIFAADHGEMGGGHGLLQKGAVMFDELYRIPLVLRWPGQIASGVHCDALVQLFDLMPTMLEVAEARVPANLDAQTLTGLFDGSAAATGRSVVFAEYLGQQNGDIPLKMVRNQEYKLALNFECEDELYDLQQDPGETHNCCLEPQYQAVHAKLAQHMLHCMTRSQDPLLEQTRAWFTGREGL